MIFDKPLRYLSHGAWAEGTAPDFLPALNLY
jgi:hypothetical protein